MTAAPVAAPHFNWQARMDWPAFRAALDAAGYNNDTLAVFMTQAWLTGILKVSAALQRTDEPGVFNTLSRLFLLGQAVPRAAFAEAMGDAWVAPLAESGVLVESAGTLRAVVALLPHEDRLIAHDIHPLFRGADMAADHVPGPGRASLYLHDLTPRAPVGRALDIGTGCGVQAVGRARHATSVVATDLSPRALTLARLTAWVNGAANIEFREGSYFDPVAGETFDLIVSNPPFIISPEQRYVYRDGGRPGDTLGPWLLREAAGRLTNGGLAVMIFNWAHRSAERWDIPLRAAVDDLGCDAWLLHIGSDDPLTYALPWLTELIWPSRAALEAETQRWLAYYRAQGIERIAFGAVLLRRRDGARHWVRSESLGEALDGGPLCSGQMLRIIANRDVLETVRDDRDLLGLHLAAAADVQLLSVAAPGPDGWRLERHRLCQRGGLGLVSDIDPRVGRLVTRCDGARPLQAVLAEFAAEQRQPLEAVAPPALHAVRLLLEGGFLTVAPGPQRQPA